jgi:hypothetical protein
LELLFHPYSIANGSGVRERASPTYPEFGKTVNFLIFERFLRHLSVPSFGYPLHAVFADTVGDLFGQPTLMLHDKFTHLWDADYQKFFITDDKRKLPALAEQLEQMRRFNGELRSALGVPAYYNEGLGSPCQVTAYDRVLGRPGDVPDESVGIKPGSEH